MSPLQEGSKAPSGDQGQATTQVREALDVQALSQWMSQQPAILDLVTLDKFQNGVLNVRQFGFGQSNPTYRISIDSDNNDDDDDDDKSKQQHQQHFVLRKKPRKVAHASAHALHREYRVLQALQHHNRLHPEAIVPVPNVYAYCRDTSILGAEFYIMQFVEGRIFTDPSLPGMSVQDRKAAYQHVLTILARLHGQVDLQQVELSNYGKPGNYVERQLERLVHVSRRQASLMKQNKNDDDSNSKNGNNDIPALAEALRTYATTCPASHTLVHGDFKMDNLVFHPTRPQVLAILDWELSTLGDAYCDLANLSMMYYVKPRASPAIAGIADLDLKALGIPSRLHVVETYCRKTGRDFATAWAWSGFYLAFLFFKNAVIVQGVAQRAQAGVASSAAAHRVARLLPIIVQQAKDILREQPPPGVVRRKRSRL